MDDRKTIIATAIFSAVPVLGVVLPLGYFSQQALDRKLDAGQAEVTRVVIDLKTETLRELKAATQRVGSDIARNGSQSGDAVTAGLETLRARFDELRANQRQLMKSVEAPSSAVSAEVSRLNTEISSLTTALNGVRESVKGVAAETRNAIGELKSQKPAEIKSGADPAVLSRLEDLGAAVRELQDGQRQVFEALNRPSEAVTAEASMPAPGSREDTLNLTVYFPLGTISGPKIDQQVAALVPAINAYARSGACQSNVMGFSDTLGGDRSNLALSRKRAAHVALLLRKHDIAIGGVKGWGERWLKVHTVDGVKNGQNRRVVIETECEGKAAADKGAVS